MIYYFPAGTLAAGSATVSVYPEQAGWTYSGLTVLHIEPGGTTVIPADDSECVVLPLSGSGEVSGGGVEFGIHGRRDVFSGTAEFGYFPRECEVTISSADGGLFAIPWARCDRVLSPRYVLAAEFEGDRLRVVEMDAPGPLPYQYDNARERIYYFQIADTESGDVVLIPPSRSWPRIAVPGPYCLAISA